MFESIAALIARVHRERRADAILVITHDERLVMLLNQLRPQFYTLEFTARRATELKAHGDSPDFYLNPPTAFTASFFGYENVFALNNSELGINVGNLLPITGHAEKDGHFCIIPPRAVKIEPGEDVQVMGVEYRSGGLKLVRCRWNDEVDVLAADRRQRNANQRGNERRKSEIGHVALTIDETQCVRRSLRSHNQKAA
jgi:hypothetical protein